MSKFYIPPGINYPSHTDPATNGRGAEIVIYPIHIRKANGYVVGAETLTDIESETVSGDLVIVYPGTYDLVDQPIKLIDGVSWRFEPGVIITTTNNNIFIDDDNVVNVNMLGQPSLICAQSPYKIINGSSITKPRMNAGVGYFSEGFLVGNNYMPGGVRLHVKPIGGDDGNSGFSWNKAKQTIAGALAIIPVDMDAVNYYILLDGGTYTINSAIVISQGNGSINLVKPMAQVIDSFFTSDNYVPNDTPATLQMMGGANIQIKGTDCSFRMMSLAKDEVAFGGLIYDVSDVATYDSISAFSPNSNIMVLGVKFNMPEERAGILFIRQGTLLLAHCQMDSQGGALSTAEGDWNGAIVVFGRNKGLFLADEWAYDFHNDDDNYPKGFTGINKFINIKQIILFQRNGKAPNNVINLDNLDFETITQPNIRLSNAQSFVDFEGDLTKVVFTGTTQPVMIGGDSGILFKNAPIADPGIADAIYSNGGILTLSTGV